MSSVTGVDVRPDEPARRTDRMVEGSASPKPSERSCRSSTRAAFRVFGIALVAASVALGAGACTSSGSGGAPTTSVGTIGASQSSTVTSQASQPSAATASQDSAATPGATGRSNAVSTAVTSSEPAAPTTAVPAPGGGNVSHTVAAATPATQSPVALSETASISKVIRATISRVADTTLTANGPGEISGPGLAVSVTVTNASSADLSLGAISVTMTDSAGRPCSFVPASESKPFAGTLAPGKTATGVYAFTIPTDKRSPVTVGLIYGPSTSVMLFTGTVH